MTASSTTVVAAMRLEAMALGGRVVRTGMGHRRAQHAAAALAARLAPGAPVVLAGISGGLASHLVPGDVIVATEVHDPEGGTRALDHGDAQAVAAALGARGRRVHLGPVVSSTTLVHGERRAELARSGALAVDMESAWVADALRAQRLVIVRVVADTAGSVAVGLFKGLGALRGLRPAFDGWSAGAGGGTSGAADPGPDAPLRSS